ncbi:MAG: DUF1592 domain-containing protein [Pirellulales bacterium]
MSGVLTALGLVILSHAALQSGTNAAEIADLTPLERTYPIEVQPLLKRYCHECHSGDLVEAEIDFSAFATLSDVRKQPDVWQQVEEMLDSVQMPPEDAAQPTDAERAALLKWVQAYLAAEARAHAADPGRVVLRRLNNAEYTYTLRDLTSVPSLDPAREFPTDSAAGEGFTNTGNALVMSPALVTKYLDAAKDVASHAVLLPDGFRFSPQTTRRDWTEEMLTAIRAFYAQFTVNGGGTAVNLQGIQFDTKDGGVLPLEKYFAATLLERDAIRSRTISIVDAAQKYNLNAKYLGTLWSALNDSEPSLVLDVVRRQWKSAGPADAPALVATIERWQKALWRFSPVGHIGKQGGPPAWQAPIVPLVSQQEVRMKLAKPVSGNDITLYLASSDAGDGNDGDFLLWENPRFIKDGQPDLPLSDVRAAIADLAASRELICATAAQHLAAADEARTLPDRPALAKKFGVDLALLAAWLDYLGIGSGEAVIDSHLTNKMERTPEYDFIKGWTGADALSALANSSEEHVRIPGNMKPHSVAVHPSPSLRIIVGWRSPVAAQMHIEGFVQPAHPECTNGVTWALELRRGNTRQRLGTGATHAADEVRIGPFENLMVHPGDVVSLSIGPRDANHSCDLTTVDLKFRDGTREWSLSKDVAPEILAGNPHADSFGNPEVWHFYSEPDNDGGTANIVPTGSLLAKWQASADPQERNQIAEELQRLLIGGAAGLVADAPDAVLYAQLTSLSGPLISVARKALRENQDEPAAIDATYGLDPEVFGKHPNGGSIDSTSICVRAPSLIEITLPADLVEGYEFVASCRLHTESGVEGSVQAQALTDKPAAAFNSDAPILVNDQSSASKRIETAFDEFRQVFPAALCYTKIVPVDEPVTLTLHYREDEQLQRLMLDESQIDHLDRLWDELHYISHDAVSLVDVLEQLIQYATQDADPTVFEPLREPFERRAALFRQRLIDTESAHLDALVRFAAQAYRRSLTDAESAQIRELYAQLRQQPLPHDEAFRLTLARVMVAPAFLYRAEKPAPGIEQRAVTDWELASRLSYFLWSSMPDAELLDLAAANRLSDPDLLIEQTRRLLRDDKSRRLATEFAGQWLHIYEFDQLDEKSERHFPTFADLRDAMQEESILFFADLFQNNGSVLDLLNADHTFLNEELANHYGIPGVQGAEWRRVDGVQQYSRGGILTLAATLAKQSGASRTSPILRGNWLCEVVLGDKLPRPPKNVPPLAEIVPDGLTERQLTEQHTSDPACAKCHARIDPFGFALENFDAIGRFRAEDTAANAINSQTQLPDGTQLTGHEDLRNYLLTVRRDDFIRQFNRKLLGYALGRAVKLSDEPLLDEMLAVLQQNDYRIASAVETIVLSRQFREIRGRDVPEDE